MVGAYIDLTSAMPRGWACEASIFQNLQKTPEIWKEDMSIFLSKVQRETLNRVALKSLMGDLS